MKWKMVSNENSNAIDNIEDKTFIQSSEENDSSLEYIIEKILQKFDSQGVDSLTLGERSRVVAWHSAMQWRMQGQFYQYQQGFLEEAALEQTLNDLASGIYQKWEELDLTERIQPFEWKQRIRDRLGQN